MGYSIHVVATEAAMEIAQLVLVVARRQNITAVGD